MSRLRETGLKQTVLAPFAACLLVTTAAGALLSPLGGPSVAGDGRASSLIVRGFEGGVVKLDAPPAIAALDLLELDEATEAKLHELFAERASILDSIVLGNIELLAEIETVMTVGRPSEKLRVFQQGLSALAPARDWGRLRDRVAGVLPDGLRERYDGLIDEYEAARYSAAKASGEVERAFEYRMQRHWEDMTWEIERAAERVLEDDGEGDAWIRKLTEGLGLTPDQEGKIRAMGERFYIETKGRPSDEEQMAFISRIRTVLTVEQRWKFTAMLLRGELEPDAGD